MIFFAFMITILLPTLRFLGSLKSLSFSIKWVATSKSSVSSSLKYKEPLDSCSSNTCELYKFPTEVLSLPPNVFGGNTRMI